MGVEVVTLAERPVDQTTEFVGTIKSRRSTTVQSQSEGFVTRVVAHSGDRVRPGSLLLEIDSGRQRETVSNLESQRASREAELQYATQQAARTKTLLDVGAVSQAELEQAERALTSAQAQLRAVEAQIREQRVELGYYRVTAPVAGVVGDIPIRPGDSVTRSTVLTTIDESAGLEVYINVPVQQAAQLKTGLDVQIVSDEGTTLATVPITFVSTSVDPTMQAILVKAALKDATGFRTDQFVRARVVWTSQPALTVPVVALNRVNGQYFAYVAESGEGGATVAKQRGVELGAVVGNDYVVRSGLKAGDRLIVSGIQKIGDGAPVKILAPDAGQGASAAPSR